MSPQIKPLTNIQRSDANQLTHRADEFQVSLAGTSLAGTSLADAKLTNTKNAQSFIPYTTPWLNGTLTAQPKTDKQGKTVWKVTLALPDGRVFNANVPLSAKFDDKQLKKGAATYKILTEKMKPERTTQQDSNPLLNLARGGKRNIINGAFAIQHGFNTAIIETFSSRMEPGEAARLSQNIQQQFDSKLGYKRSQVATGIGYSIGNFGTKLVGGAVVAVPVLAVGSQIALPATLTTGLQALGGVATVGGAVVGGKEVYDGAQEKNPRERAKKITNGGLTMVTAGLGAVALGKSTQITARVPLVMKAVESGKRGKVVQALTTTRPALAVGHGKIAQTMLWNSLSDTKRLAILTTKLVENGKTKFTKKFMMEIAATKDVTPDLLELLRLKGIKMPFNVGWSSSPTTLKWLDMVKADLRVNMAIIERMLASDEALKASGITKFDIFSKAHELKIPPQKALEVLKNSDPTKLALRLNLNAGETEILKNVLGISSSQTGSRIINFMLNGHKDHATLFLRSLPDFNYNSLQIMNYLDRFRF